MSTGRVALPAAGLRGAWRGRAVSANKWLLLGARTKSVWIVGALAGALALVYKPGDTGYDSAYSVLWGHELAHLHQPDFSASVAPTPHPLANLVGTLASLTGTHAYSVLLVVSFVSFALLGYSAFLAGTRSFGPIAGFICAAILLTRPFLVGEALQSSLDIPCLALVFSALAVEFGDRPRPVTVIACLTVAGLLRPEVWLLSAGYLVWLLRTTPPHAVARLGLLAALAPLLWIAADLAVSGDPLYSLTRTQTLAEALARPRGLGSALYLLPGSLAVVIGSSVVWCGIAACSVASWFLYERARLPSLLLLSGATGFLVLGLAGMPVLDRYVLVPAGMLALFAGAAVSGWRLLPRGTTMRRTWQVCSVVAVAVLLASIPSTGTALSSVFAHARGRQTEQIQLRSIVRTAQVGGWIGRCGLIQAPTHRIVPFLALWLGVRPSRISVVVPSQSRSGLVLTAARKTLEDDAGLFPGTVVTQEQLNLPAGFHRVTSTSAWTLAERC